MALLPRRSPLFSAVVLAGVALTTGPMACGSEEVAEPGDASTNGGEAGGGASEGGSAVDATPDHLAADATASDACPPDAELPVPPCYLIK